MTISVDNITPHEDMQMSVSVSFYEKSSSGPVFSANVTVFIDNRDRLLSEIKAEAIEKAKAFLLHAASSR